MAIKRTKLGPGTLYLGETASGKEFSTGVTKCTVEPSYSEGDTIAVLSGDRDTEAGEWEGKLTGEFYQEYTNDSLLKWTWDNDGKLTTFKFVPHKTSGLTVTGKVTVRPVNIGGDVDVENTTEFEWTMPTKPTITIGTDSRPGMEDE